MKPNLFLDFETNLPAENYIFKPLATEEPNDEETLNSRKKFISHVFSESSISREIIYKTEWAIIARPLSCLPESDGKKTVQKYNWFAGFYDWNSVFEKLIALSSDFKSEFSIYIVPSLGQSIQTSNRFELVFNVFISPTELPPFSNVILRLPSEEKQDEGDDELLRKYDPCYIKTLDSQQMEWSLEIEKTSQDLSLDFNQTIKFFLLKPTKSFRTGLTRMEEGEFEIWYDCMMSNFLPLIPFPPGPDGLIRKLPLVLIDSIEATPPKYSTLIQKILEFNNSTDKQIKM